MTQMLPRLVLMMEQSENVKGFLEDVATNEKTVTILIEELNDVVPINEGA